jgi:NhaA family Na+:H+ antiporter
MKRRAPRFTWLASDRALPRRVARPIRLFMSTETSGGIVLLVAAAVALVWVNSPFGDSYEELWGTRIDLHIGSFSVNEDLRGVINNGLMTLFFFVVGLEIKRELVSGELSEPRRAILPAIAALGGMVVPALLYAAFNAGGNGSAGWGIPMATDIAFAVGLLTLLGPRCPTGLKIFLLSLAIVDDVGAIVVIAIFYSGGIDPAWLVTALVLLATVAGLRRSGVWWTPAYAFMGTLVWFATLESGVHATIAGVALGLMTPAVSADPEGAEDAIRSADLLLEYPSPEHVRSVMKQAEEVVPVGERLEHLLHPWSSFAIVPLFALANSGIKLGGGVLGDAFSSPVTLGVVVGLVVGKVIGISTASYLAVRRRWGELPAGVNWQQVIGASAVAGIGFTVSLFIAGLAFDPDGVVFEAKLGIFAGSVIAALVGWVLLRLQPAE